MDRLPLVQALTEAGLERRGAEQVATALGDAIESSVATKADVARLEASVTQLGFSTRADVVRLEASIAQLGVSTKADLTAQDASTKIEFSRLRAEMQAMELRLTLRLGGLMVTISGLLFAALRFIGHAP